MDQLINFLEECECVNASVTIKVGTTALVHLFMPDCDVVKKNGAVVISSGEEIVSLSIDSSVEVDTNNIYMIKSNETTILLSFT